MAKACKFKNKAERYKVGRRVSELLRVDTEARGLNPDCYGFVDMDMLMDHLRPAIPYICREHLLEIVQKDAQNRFEIDEDRIRTRAGHRYLVEIPHDPIKPPELLFHGTCREAAAKIIQNGLLKMGKAYVHLAGTVERAMRVGHRKSAQPALLVISASKAWLDGVRFWRSGQVSPDGEIYLSDEIPPEFISEHETPLSAP